jgi:hypothetical protein
MGKKRHKAADAGKSGAGAAKTWLDETAFRHAEKAYRWYKHSDSVPTDFRSVVDFMDANSGGARRAARPPWPRNCIGFRPTSY